MPSSVIPQKIPFVIGLGPGPPPGEGEAPPPAPESPAEETGGLFAAYSYEILAPLADPDAARGYPLRALCRAVGAMFSEVEVVRAQGGKDAWRKPFDVATCPDLLLPFLGLFVGEQVDPATDTPDKRQQIEEEGNFHRGRPSAMISRVSRTLTGTRRVRLVERASTAWRMLVVTDPSETPNPSATAAEAFGAKPGGIVLTVEQSSVPLIDEGTREIDKATEGTINTVTLAQVN